MGAYLCIATNGVPPSVSKRIIVDVECKCNFYPFIGFYLIFFHPLHTLRIRIFARKRGAGCHRRASVC